MIHTACVTIEAGSATWINLLTTNGVAGPLIQDYRRSGTPILSGYGVEWYTNNGSFLASSDPSVAWAIPSSVNLTGASTMSSASSTVGPEHVLQDVAGTGGIVHWIDTNYIGWFFQNQAVTHSAVGGGLHLFGNGYNTDPSVGGIEAGASSDGGTWTARGTTASGSILADGTIGLYANTGLTVGSTFSPNYVINLLATGPRFPLQHSLTGTRYACLDTAGNLVASATACSGT